MNPGPVADCDDRADLGLLRAHKFSETEVKAFSQAKNIVVQVPSIRPPKESTTIENALSWCILSEITPEAQVDSVLTAQLLYTKHLLPMWPGYWFICIDEIGVFEGDDIGTQFPEITAKENRYLPLMQFTQDLIWGSEGKVFIFLCGKSWTLINLALRLSSSSPVSLHYLAMGALHVPDIEEILKGTECSKYLPKTQVTPLAEVIYHLSGGVPRFIETMCHYLHHYLQTSTVTVEGFKNLLSPESIIGQKILQETTLVVEPLHPNVPRPELDKHEVTLLHMYLLDLVIPSLHAANILSVFPCYITPFGTGFKPIFSRYWLYKMEKRNLTVPLSTLPCLLQTSPPTLPQGRLLELIGSEVLSSCLMYTSEKTVGSVLEFLQDTMPGQLLLPGSSATAASSSNLRALFQPTVAPSLNANTTRRNPTDNSFNTNDWDLYINALQEKCLNKIAIPSSPQSQGPDLLIPLACNSEKTAIVACGTEPTVVHCLLEFAFKNIQGGPAGTKGTSSWKDIREEVQKGLYAPRTLNALTASTHFTLVFASMELKRKVFTVFKGNPWVVLSSGDNERKWQLRPGTHGMMLEEEPDSTAPTISIPPNCDLVILGAEGMDTLFGKEVIEKLQQCFSASMDTYFERFEETIQATIARLMKAQLLLGKRPHSGDAQEAIHPQGKMPKTEKEYLGNKLCTLAAELREPQSSSLVALEPTIMSSALLRFKLNRARTTEDAESLRLAAENEAVKQERKRLSGLCGDNEELKTYVEVHLKLDPETREMTTCWTCHLSVQTGLEELREQRTGASNASTTSTAQKS
ncbi:hypothetical protein Pelo_4059 [Pelomyxa schiedti]|nr:hypothetical protein Pelo_4059 [Pelomyxa schiedti]